MDKTLVLPDIPMNLAQWQNMGFEDLSQPEHTVAKFLCALHLFTLDREAGVEAINALKGPASLSNHDIQFLQDRLMDKAYLPLAYLEGAKPENGYKAPRPYTLRCLEDKRPYDVEEGYMRIYLKTAGADSPRGVVLRKKGNLWYIWDYPGLLMGIRIPAHEDPWA